jgi:hypothetical protein
MATTRGKLQLRPKAPVPVALPVGAPAAASPREREGRGQSPAARVDRQGKKLIAGHFSKTTWATLRSIGTDLEKTTQDLLQEALDDLFAKYRRSSV